MFDIHSQLIVLLPECVFRPNDFRILDLVSLQRPIHPTPTFRDRCLRSIHLRSPARQISTTVPTRSERNLLPDAFFHLLGWKWFLPFPSCIHILLVLLLRRFGAFQWPNRWPLALGNLTLHGCHWRCPPQSSACRQCLDKVYLYRHPRLIYHLVGLHPGLCNRCTYDQWPFKRASWARSGYVYIPGLLRLVLAPSAIVSHAGLCMEVRQAHVLSAIISSCAGDPKVQRTGLPAQDGAIPEGCTQSATSAKNAEAARLCF